MKQRAHNKQAGVVSLFTVIFFTILISVLTIGFIRIMLNERRNATDEDLSTRAYYAAESGVEDAKRALAEYHFDQTLNDTSLNSNTCAAPEGYSKVISTEPNVGYSCMLLDTTPPNIEASLPASGDGLQWQLSAEGNQNFNRVRISWHSLNEEIDGTPVAFRSPAADENPTLANWQQTGTQFPALLRAQFFGMPSTGTSNRAQIEDRNRVAFLNPATSGNPNLNLATLDSGSAATAKSVPEDVRCTTDPAEFGGYACQATININPVLNANSDLMFLRLKSLYDQGGTKVRVELMNGNNVLNARSQAIVDVTGRAGDVLRRVQARVNLNATPLVPEFAVESGDSICKRFELTDTTEILNGCAVR